MTSEGLAIELGSAETHTLRAGESTPFLPEDWHDALVMVQCGVLQVRCPAGGSAEFGRGSIVCFKGVTPASLVAGAEDVVLLVVRR